MSKFCVIIPVYNCRQYLKECVDSILNQTIRDFEMILVDDGSTDGSGTLCDELSKQDERIRVFHKQNGGAGSARNMGIDHSKGEYLVFVDADDVIEEEYLERAEPFLCDSTMLSFGIDYDTYDKGRLINTEKLGFEEIIEYDRGMINDNLMILFEKNGISSACSKIIPMKMISAGNARFCEDLKAYEDLDFVLQCLKATETYIFYPYYAYHYRIQKGKSKLLSRVPDVHGLDLIISRLGKTICALNENGSNNLEDDVFPRTQILTSIVSFLTMELLRDNTNSYRQAKQIAVKINNLPHFRKMYLFNEKTGISNPKHLMLIYNRKYVDLWIWSRRKKIMHRLLKVRMSIRSLAHG